MTSEGCLLLVWCGFLVRVPRVGREFEGEQFKLRTMKMEICSENLTLVNVKLTRFKKHFSRGIRDWRWLKDERDIQLKLNPSHWTPNLAAGENSEEKRIFTLEIAF